MPVQAGSRIGPYEIETALGAGGMGEVYRARDTRLNRRVAIKSLPAAFAQDAERVARFKREAQLLAALNHPHIAGIHGLEESNGSQFLVLELVDGETLADRLTKGPIPVDEAIRIAREVIDALEAAHEKGIVHRDLKPGNVALTADGQVKVLDFGLARFEAGDGASTPDLTASPTLAYAGTQAGIILGTAAYMSPEQAKGRAVDKRSDVWSFGCLLFEMLTGKKAFEGEDVSDTLAAILRGDPEWSLLPVDVPAAVRTVIKRCLEKDRRQRIPDFSVVRFMIDEALRPQAALPQPATPISPVPSRPPLIPWLIATTLGAGLVVAVALWKPWRETPSVTPLRVDAQIGADTSLLPGLGSSVAFSPDGGVVAFVGLENPNAQPQLFVRRLDQLTATMFTGTDGAVEPFFSPDGQSIGFAAGGKLKKVAVSGGAAVTLCDAPNARGGWWADDDTIVFQPEASDGRSLMRVPAAGGTPAPLIPMAESERLQRWPQMLPGSRAVLYSSLSNSARNWDSGEIVVKQLPDGPRKVVQKGAFFGRYLRSGHLVYVQQGTLFAVPFDLARLEPTGAPVPVIERVMSFNGNGSAQIAISDSGTVGYVSGAGSPTAAPIAWLDQSGKTTPLRATSADWSNPSFSPDGTRLAMDISDGVQSDIWIYDWARDTLSRLTFDKADDTRPSWTPDGKRIVFASKRVENGTQDLYWQHADGTGEVQKLTSGPNVKYGGSFHPSGKFLVYSEQSANTSADIMILPIEGDEAGGWKPGTPKPFLAAPYNESSPQFSPDGRWIAYISSESGPSQIYVRPFPGPGGKWQISNGAGDDPTWSPTKPELFFGQPSGEIMRVPYTVEGDSFRADKPQLWSAGPFSARPRTPSRDLDIHPDGKRFAIAPGQAIVARKQDKMILIFNFFEEIKRLTAKK